MRQKHEAKPGSAEKTVRDIRRATRRRHSSEEKIRIVLEGLRGEDSIAELCRREGLNQNGKPNTKDVLEEKAKLVTDLIIPNCDSALLLAAALKNTNPDIRLGEEEARQAGAETAALLPRLRSIHERARWRASGAELRAAC
jgi:transposase-like protein